MTLVAHPHRVFPPPQRHGLPRPRARVAHPLAAVPAVVQRQQRPERLLADGAVDALVVGRPIDGTRRLLQQLLGLVVDDRLDGRQRAHHRLTDHPGPVLGPVGRRAEAGRRVAVAAVAHPHLREPAPGGDGLAFGGARVADGLAAGAAVVLLGGGGERAAADVAVLEGLQWCWECLLCKIRMHSIRFLKCSDNSKDSAHSDNKRIKMLQ